MSETGPKGITNDQILAAIDQTGTQAGAAALLGLNKRTIERRMHNMQKGVSAEQRNDNVLALREDEVFKGRSVLWNPATGEHKLEWVKTDRDKQAQLEALKEAAQALKDDIPAIPPIPKPKHVYNELMNLFVFHGRQIDAANIPIHANHWRQASRQV